MYRCRGCATLRRLVEPSWESCKPRRLCHEVDPSLTRVLVEADGTDSVPLVRALHLATIVERNLASATQFAETEGYPRRDYFCHWLLGAHGRLFHGCGLAFAGRFRVAGEDAYFGGDGRFQLRGCNADEIPRELTKLAASMFGSSKVADLDQEAFLFHSALFLERFFKIHPFVDGNGRIARMLLRVAARATGRFMFSPFNAKNSRERRRYISALQLAHARPELSSSYRPMQQWLRAFIVEGRDSSTVSEAEPPTSSSDAERSEQPKNHRD